MEFAPETVIPAIEPEKKHRWLKIFLKILAIVLFLGLAGSVLAVVYRNYYEDRVYPGIFLGNYDLGGMKKEELKIFVDNLNDRLVKEDINYFLVENGNRRDFKVDTILQMGEDSLPLITFHNEVFVNKVMGYGRQKDDWRKYLDPLLLLVLNEKTEFDLKFDKFNFKENLRKVLDATEDKAHSADVQVTSLAPLQYEIIPEKVGQVFDYDKIVENTENNLKVLNLEAIKIERHQFFPRVLSGDLQSQQEKISNLINCGDLKLVYETLDKKQEDFTIRVGEISRWLSADKDEKGNLFFTLNQDKITEYLQSLKSLIDVPVENPKFKIENGKVREFKGEETGLSLSVEKTISAITENFKQRNCEERTTTPALELAVEKVESDLKLDQINDFGINEIIGTGVSTFVDSHTNRIKNIAHAVERLNGTLIAPDEEFSAIKYTGPFTAENGYLPEEVIKGDKIEKEIGGGMCQIGTTLFRMAMNSGMDITERHNHSLVVSYYADPVNKNPGTDAALYEPILDFKFKNDTGNYLLLQTKIDYKKQRLEFSLWGKNDGRQGFYSHPVVSRWIPTGDPIEIVSEELKQGEVKCQNAFRGAVSSFLYTRFTSTSEKIERTFTSYYRPLAKMCLIGPGTTSTLPIATTTPSLEITTSSTSTPAL